MEYFIKHVPDLKFSIIAQVLNSSVDFNVYDIIGWSKEHAPLWRRAGSVSSLDTVTDLSESEPYLHGEVLGNGCSNWYFDWQDKNLMLHGCTREDVQNFGNVMAVCWDWAMELLVKK